MGREISGSLSDELAGQNVNEDDNLKELHFLYFWCWCKSNLKNLFWRPEIHFGGLFKYGIQGKCTAVI